MHEYGITLSIINTVLQATVEHNSTEVLEVELILGRLTFLNPVQVQYAYQFLTRETILEGSTLVIEEVEGAIRCLKCNRVTTLELPQQGCFEPMPSFCCPACGGNVEIVQGKECLIKGAKMI